MGGTIDLHEGVVADNPIGINIQTEGFDLGRIRDRVTWGPNHVNLATTRLPVPEATPPGGP